MHIWLTRVASIHIIFVLFSHSSLLSIALTSDLDNWTARAAALERPYISSESWYVIVGVFGKFAAIGA